MSEQNENSDPEPVEEMPVESEVASTSVEDVAPAEAEAQPIEFEKIPAVEEASSDESAAMEAAAPVIASQAVSPPPPTAPASPPPPPPPAAPAQPQPLSESEEHTWAMLANLSVLLNLVTGILGPVVALIIYLIFRERSAYVRFQAMQAFVFQLVWWILAGIVATLLWILVGVLAIICVGLCLTPIAILVSLLPLAALVYGVYGAIETSQGKDFRYWLIGNWVKNDITG